MANPPPAPVPRKYPAQPGDTLSKIYGYAERYMKIFRANRDQLDNPNLIQPGMVPVIPE
jgi:nucleoid-associated protein YgaU